MDGPLNLRTMLAVSASALVLAGCGVEDPGAVDRQPDRAGVDAGSDVGGSGSGSGASGRPAVAAEPEVPALGTDADALDEAVVTIRGRDLEVPVDVKVAATDADRRRGLMRVAELPAGVGMLFVYDEDRDGGFWMRDTLIPLDIAYIAADGQIGTILSMDPCDAEAASDCPVYTPATPYRSALEVPQGWFASVGVAEGDHVTWSEPTPAR